MPSIVHDGSVGFTAYRFIARYSLSLAKLFFPRIHKRLGFRHRWGKLSADEPLYVPNLCRVFDSKVALATASSCENKASRHVSAKTWEDLDFDEIFHLMDSCVTGIGKQSLYDTLRTFRSHQELKSRFSDIQALMANAVVREEAQMTLTQLEDHAASGAVASLYGDFEPLKYPALVLLQSVLTIVSIALCFFSTLFVPVVVVLCVINFIVTLRTERKVVKFMGVYAQLSDLLFCSYGIANINGAGDINSVSKLLVHRSRIYWLAQRLRFFAVDRVGGMGLVNAAFFWVNLVSLLDLVIYIRGVSIVKANQSFLTDVIEHAATLDEHISIGNYLTAANTISNPEFVSERVIVLEEVYHPLIVSPVTNSTSIQQASVLVAGSNMAGKTTYIKTVGVNVILAQTLWFAHAKKICIEPFEVCTAIKRDDAISRGESYYFAELKLILEMINKAESDVPHLFLIDEIFRGTNTTERVAASSAVLEKLGNCQTVFVTTHDVELIDRLAERYQIVHFKETGNPHAPFDYKICAGKPQGRNAITLLERIGYPKDIVAKANNIVTDIEATLGSRKQ